MIEEDKQLIEAEFEYIAERDDSIILQKTQVTPKKCESRIYTQNLPVKQVLSKVSQAYFKSFFSHCGMN
jgi:hypothetical protein